MARGRGNTTSYPEHVSIFQVGLGVTLLGMNKMGELGGISDEEDGRVVEHPIKVTLFSSDLDGKATGVTGSICRPEFTTDSGESDSGTVLLSDLREEPGSGNIAEAVGQFKITVCTSAFGVDLTYSWSAANKEKPIRIENARHALGYARDQSVRGDQCGESLVISRSDRRGV